MNQFKKIGRTKCANCNSNNILKSATVVMLCNSSNTKSAMAVMLSVLRFSVMSLLL